MKRAIAIVALLFACSPDKVESPVGAVAEYKKLVLGTEPQEVTLGSGAQRVTLTFPENAVARRTEITVRLETGVAKRGAIPSGDATIHIATRDLTFNEPALMRQRVIPPQAGEELEAVFAQPDDAAWSSRGPAQPVGTANEEGQEHQAAVRGSGLWAIARRTVTADAGAPDLPRDTTPADMAPRPTPQIASMTPAMGTGNTLVMMTVTGTNFINDAAVYFDNLAVPTTFSNATTLIATVLADKTAFPGQYAVWVVNGPGGPRSNTLYFNVNPAPGAPVVVDYSPDNGMPGDKITILGRDLVGSGQTITDAQGMAAIPGTQGTAPYWGQTLQTVEFQIPPGWTLGPITFNNDRGRFRGKIFTVGRNLSLLPESVITASSEYNTTNWSKASGADNKLVTSWFSRNGDCASIMSCTSIPFFQIAFPQQAVARIAMRGNREYSSGYDFIRGRFEVLSGDQVLWSASYDLPQPDRDLDIVFATPIAGATAVKFTSEKDESIEPGFSELEIFSP